MKHWMVVLRRFARYQTCWYLNHTGTEFRYSTLLLRLTGSTLFLTSTSWFMQLANAAPYTAISWPLHQQHISGYPQTSSCPASLLQAAVSLQTPTASPQPDTLNLHGSRILTPPSLPPFPSLSSLPSTTPSGRPQPILSPPSPALEAPAASAWHSAKLSATRLRGGWMNCWELHEKTPLTAHISSDHRFGLIVSDINLR